MNDQSLEVALEPQSMIKIERFVDTVCDQLLINDTYYGSILMAVTEMFSICLEKSEPNTLNIQYNTDYQILKINFQPIDTELINGFSQQSAADFNFGIKEGKSIFLIKSLTDSVKILGADSIELEFDISAMHNKVYTHRLDTLNEYFSKSRKEQLTRENGQL